MRIFVVLLGLISSTRLPAAQGLQTMVWVNANTHVYHCPGDPYFGNSKDGEYMNEAAARARGNRASQDDACPKDAKPVKLVPPRLGDVWVSTQSMLYYCPSNKYYGNTKRGKFLSEKEARTAGARPATRKCG